MESHNRKGTAMASDNVGVEREVKFGVDLSFALPNLGGVCPGITYLPDQELRAEYLDTADRRLWHRDITLRFRTVDHAGIGTWTLKLPTAGFGPTLDGTELSWLGPREAIPAEATRVLRGLVRGSTLDRLVEMVTARRRFALHDADGGKWGELDDDTVAVIGGPRDGTRFRQIEVELESVGRSGLDGVVEQLRVAGAIVDNQPKVAKALGRAGLASADDVAPVDGGASLGDVVRASIANALDGILDHDYRLRLEPFDPLSLSVHHGRVASRRLRSDLKTLRPVLDPDWMARIRPELQWLGEVLGRVRDADVLAGHLSAARAVLLEDAEGIDELEQRLAHQRRTACWQLAEVLDSQRYVDLVDQLHTAARTTPFTASGRPGRPSPVSRVTDPASFALPPLIRDRFDALRQKVDGAGSHPSDVELHGIRIGAKQVRYAAEMAIPVIGIPARLTSVAAQKLQTVLGEHHDAVVAVQWLRQEGLAGTLAAGFAAGRLAAEQYRRQKRRRRQWRLVWDRLDSKEVRGWIS
jgi:CHAD domain-containing protein